MALIRDLSKAQLAFQVAGGTVDQFLVTRYRGTEGLCRLYRFEIELTSAEESVAFDDIVGKAATLSVNTDFGTRWFHGIVSRFEMTGSVDDHTYFRAELVPSVWLLTHRYNCRIFQNKTVPEIISAILEGGGIPSDRFRLVLERTYEPREYCVQYRETDYNFICRLMEEEGIWWCFEQTQEDHTFVMADSSSAYAPIEGEPDLPYQPPAGMVVSQEHISRFRLGQCVRPGAVVLDDFNFENPKLKLQAKSDVGRDAGLEFSDYPGEYLAQAEGASYAQLRAQEFESARVLGVGEGNCFRLSPGLTFNLIDHPSQPVNATYLLTAVTHQGKQATARASTGANGRGGVLDQRVHQAMIAARQHAEPAIRNLAEGLLQIVNRIYKGDQTAHRALTQWVYHAGQVSRDLPSAASASGGNPLEALAIPNLLEDLLQGEVLGGDSPVYQCRFECIPSSVVYRSPRVTPWPVMRGTQTARVVGPSGEEIYTDPYGRVKVQFNWDREGKFDENSSCWIRVSQGSAGGQYGSLFLPRIGQEVIVDFLEGDPDKPIITGRVYNADLMPPYTLPDEKTKSVIKTHSSKGGGGTNEIRIEDLKDKEQILIYAQKDLHVRVNSDRVENVDKDRHLTVKEHKYELVKKAKNIEVKLDFKEKIGGDKSLSVGGKDSIKVGGTRTVDVGRDVIEKFGASHKHEVTQTYACKAMSIKLEASIGIELKCGGSSIILTPAAIFIMGGPLVNINCGSGPPVGPVMAMPSAPAAPEPPVDADSVQPGKDVTYGGGGELTPGEVGEDISGITFEPEEVEERKTTWIEIELVDESSQPVVGERYQITAPDGETVKEGSLDKLGQAHVTLPEPQGTCQISFPNLDQEAWERL
ncbi:MAG: type VI secretion system tip protein VgrG [Phycisphaerae bacterium]|nr:type VI secretion system tip protein VgrG [Phycisphaerae bacterium]